MPSPDPQELWNALRSRAEAGSSLEHSIDQALLDLAGRGMSRSGIAVTRVTAVAAQHGLAWDAATREFVPEHLARPAVSAEQRILLSIAAASFHSEGEWPLVRDVVRFAVRDEGILDALEVAASLAPPVAHTQGERVVLTAEGLAAANGNEDLLSALVGLGRLAADAYLGDNDDATITSAAAREELKLDDVTLAKLHTLLGTEQFFLAGGHSNDEGWAYNVSPNAAKLHGCMDIDAYLRARRASTSTHALQASLARYEPDDEPAAQPVSMSWPGLHALHPLVREAARDLFRDGHYSQAIFEVFKTLELRVRQQSGLDASGRDLMARAFAGDSPPIVLTQREGMSGRDEQEGLRLIFMGAIQGIRNPRGHDTVLDGDPERTLECLALASLLLHQLDDAR